MQIVNLQGSQLHAWEQPSNVTIKFSERNQAHVSRISKRGFQYAIKVHVGQLLGGSRGMLPQEKFGVLTFWDHFWCILGMKLQKLDDLLLNLVVVFEACRIKGMTPLLATEAAKKLVIFVSRGKISAPILTAYITIPSCRGSNAWISFTSLAHFAHYLYVCDVLLAVAIYVHVGHSCVKFWYRN